MNALMSLLPPMPLLPVVLAAIAALALGALACWVVLSRRPARAALPTQRSVRAYGMSDPLTGLLNRAGLDRQLEKGLSRLQAGKPLGLGIVLVDLDRFHFINESFGAGTGDALLREVARRILSILRDGDVAARLSGDQFVIASATVTGADAAVVIARNLQRVLDPAYAMDGEELSVSAAIGIALAGPSGESPNDLLAAAQAAMRQAKSSGGRRYRVFEPSMLINRQRELSLEAALRRAMPAGEFSLVYQPIVRAGQQEIRAVEALLRWNSPHQGNVPPAEFIPILEQCGLIVDVGNWVLREAARRVHSWMQRGAPPITVSVNVSPLQFADPDFVPKTLNTLLTVGLDPKLLQLEVTEGLLLDPSAETLSKLDTLANAGIRLAVDDFGMGYSSLAYLKRFRLHALKIDRMFVKDVMEVNRDAAVVKAIIDLAHALDLSATAEGVETADQAQLLQSFGCDMLQGYWFAMPMSEGACFERIVGSADAAAPRFNDWSTTLCASLDLDTR